MIHYTENDVLEIDGTGGEILAEVGIISVHIIQQMIKIGMSKSDAINKIYETLENSIKIYESDGEL